MSEKLSARAILTAAGWSEDRSIDTSSAEVSLTSAGYPFWPGLGEFLRQYSQLSIMFFSKDRPDFLWFDAGRAARLTTPDTVRSYEAEFGTVLTPVGCAHDDYILLLAGKNGRFYGVYDAFTAELGSSAEDVVDWVTNG